MDLTTKCACQGNNLDKFIQPIILSILEKESYTGYQILKRMTEYVMFSSQKPDPTGVYRYLKTMAGKGVILSYEEENTQDRPKTFYTITDDGRKCLETWKSTLEDYCSDIQLLIKQL